MVARTHERGVPVAIHAIGDRAICMALAAIENARRSMPNADPRHGVVHCQITERALLDRFSEAGAAAFVQPVFIDYDMDICESRVGKEKAASSYAWRTLPHSGVPVAFGTTARWSLSIPCAAPGAP
ncbi:MAG: Amidohydrolase family protein [Firmicutes bacterium ADurb.Bin248]|nr:MAG: Amidohydrolase family protein [Firmicutes bacterium ADurb.Bin248]